MTVQPRSENKPEIAHGTPTAYAFTPHRVPLSEVGNVSVASFDRIREWLKQHRQTPIAAPFVRYRRIEMTGTLDIEIGVPVEAPGKGGDGIGFGEIPAGPYARLLWSGPYDTLIHGNSRLVEWGKQRGIHWDMAPSPDGDLFAARLETFLIGPAQEPDPAKWLTEIAIRVAERASSEPGNYSLSVP